MASLGDHLYIGAWRTASTLFRDLHIAHTISFVNQYTPIRSSIRRLFVCDVFKQVFKATWPEASCPSLALCSVSMIEIRGKCTGVVVLAQRHRKIVRF